MKKIVVPSQSCSLGNATSIQGSDNSLVLELFMDLLSHMQETDIAQRKEADAKQSPARLVHTEADALQASQGATSTCNPHRRPH